MLALGGKRTRAKSLVSGLLTIPVYKTASREPCNVVRSQRPCRRLQGTRRGAWSERRAARCKGGDSFDHRRSALCIRVTRNDRHGRGHLAAAAPDGLGAGTRRPSVRTGSAAGTKGYRRRLARLPHI